MQMEQGCDAAPHDVGAQVQVLMEEYLREKEMGIGCPGTRGAGGSGVGSESVSDPRHPTRDTLRQAVVDGMAPLVESIARRYAGTRETGGEALDDLISEGYVGLLTAIDQYRVDRGARFSTYATHRVHGQIRHYLRDRGNRRLIRAPSWLQELIARLQKEEARLQADLGRQPTTAELAERLNLQEEAVEELQTRGGAPAVLSLTERSGDDDEGGGGVDLGKIRHHHYVSWQLPVEDHIFLEGLMERLKELERKVIMLFFFQDLSQSEIARSMDISCNYVGYLLKNGLRKLRTLIEADELRDAQLRVTYAPRRIASDRSVIDSATGLYSAAYFHGRLAEEIARACRYRRSLALVAFRLEGWSPAASCPSVAPAETVRKRGRPRRVAPAAQPEENGPGQETHDSFPTQRDRDPRVSADAWRELGTALRECLRKADIPARLDERTLAVALPHTGEAAAAAARRMTDLLSQVAGCDVSSGLALYPDDGREAATLIQAATFQAATGGGSPSGDEELPALPASGLPGEPALACPTAS
jgi:RNA polymerase sigma-B factor